MRRTCRLRRQALGVALILTGSAALSVAGVVLRNIESANGWQILFFRAASFVVVMAVVLAARRLG